MLALGTPRKHLPYLFCVVTNDEKKPLIVKIPVGGRNRRQRIIRHVKLANTTTTTKYFFKGDQMNDISKIL